MTIADFPQRASMWLAYILIAPQLGHGRATEFLLACMAGSYGLALILDPSLGFDNQATRGLFWKGMGEYIAVGLLTKATLSSWGLIANLKDWPFEDYIRFFGGFVGSCVWLWFFFQFNFESATGAFGTFACFWFFMFSIRIMGMSFLGLPIPGTPGQV